jgi:hypothetical protein
MQGGVWELWATKSVEKIRQLGAMTSHKNTNQVDYWRWVVYSKQA